MSEESIDFLSSYSSQLNEIKRCMILQKKQVDNSKNDQTKATIGQPDEVLLEVIKSICQSISNHRMHSSVSSEVCLQCPSLYFIIEVLSTLGDRNEFIQQQIIHNFINSHKVDSKMSYVMEDYISDIEQELAEISETCVSFVTNNLGTNEAKAKKKGFLKPVSLPPKNNSRGIRKNKVKEIVIKSKAVVATNSSRKVILQSIQCSDLLSIAEMVAFLCLNVDKLLIILPSDILVNTLLQRSGVGLLSSGCRLISALRLIYEQILPLLLYLMRESKDHSDQSTRDDLSKYLSICSQRSLNSTHKLFTTANVKILALVEQNSKSTITFKYSSTGNQNYQSKDDMDGWIKWTDLLSSLLTTDESVSTYGYDLEPWITEAINIDTGAFISDLCRVYSQSVWEFISDACLLEDGSSERAEYLHSALQAPAGLLTHSSSKQSNSHNSSSFAKSSSSDYNNSDLNARLTTQAVNESSQPSSNFTEAMTLLKSMFPTYGDLFIGACLQVFDGNAERAVDAILADNLPLELLSVDRSLKSAWVGKGGEDYVAVKVGAQGKTGDEVYALEDDLNVKAAVKTRMTQERQQWEQSLRIIQREYDDDYDDQFDDAIAYKSSAQLKPIVEESLNPNTRSWQHSQHQQHSVRGGGDTDWNTRMAEMKLLNQLTREDEQEVQYWKNMRNTNHDKAIASSSQAWKASGDDSDVQPLDNNSGATSNVAINKGNVPSTGTQQRRPQDNTKQPQRVNTQPKKLPNNTSKEKKGESAHSAAKDTAEPTDQSGASGSSSHQSNHRHKTFDKHHQKERASRKMI